ncbi:MAG TPA: BTAD domain-containing putative transcriptional regulator [Gemmatimonadaceae bacterium]|nr:BTAD domain-containing putative transcriptional regulator [Gemmatimonadaceae bacterium]
MHTFGGVFIARDGEPLGGAAAQRRLLALLAVLSASGEGGVSRDRLLGLLWPEVTADRARHALTQALYNARRALGCDDLFVAGGDIRINPDCLTSDVGQFIDAIDRGDHAAAAALHEGPFLDGLFITGAAEFEQWTSAQRMRFAADAASALDELASRADARGHASSAIDHRRRRVALDPFDSAAVVRLMSSLAEGGDVAGALQQARVHEALLRQSLDVAPHASVVELVARLRAMNTPTAEPAATLGDANRLVSPRAHGEAGVATASASVALRAHRSRWIGGLAAVAAAFVAVTATVVAVSIARNRSAATSAVAASANEAVVVAPFRVTGADPSLAYLREGIVELLSVRLADDTAKRAVDPGVVLSRWRAAGLIDAADVGRADAAKIAGRLGAHTVVVGSVVGGASKLLVSASLVGVPDGEVRVSESVEGPADSLSSLVEHLAVKLLAADAGEGERLDGDRALPLVSLRAYLRGQAAFRRGKFSDALSEYEYALSADSTFALAALRVALTANRLNAAEQHDRALALAWRRRESLNARDRAQLVAFAGPSYPAPSSEAEHLAAWERAAMLAPDRAEVWLELGERFFYEGAMIGAADWRQRATAAFRRTLALDPNATQARALLILSDTRVGDSTGLARDATASVLADSVGGLRSFLGWRVGIARDDDKAVQRVRDVFPQLDAPNLRSIAMSSLYDAVGVADGERALRVRRALATRSADELDALLAQHAFALNQGRPIFALDITEQLQELQPGTRAHLRLRVLDALYANGDSAAAVRAAAELARLAGARSPAVPEAQAAQLADLCVLEQWRLARGDRRTATRAIARLREAGSLFATVPVASPPLACAELLSAMHAVGVREPNAVAQVQRLDSLMLTGPAVSDAATYAHLVIARLYERLGDRQRALDALRRRGYMTGWPRYLATAREGEGRLALALGDTAGAVRAYGAYLALRGDAEESAIAADRSIQRLVVGLTRR